MKRRPNRSRIEMLKRPSCFRDAAAFCLRGFAAPAIKFDLSRPHVGSVARLDSSVNFSREVAASQLVELHQHSGLPLPPTTPVSISHSLSPIIRAIASRCRTSGESAVIELPCRSYIVDAIAESSLKLSFLGRDTACAVDSRHIVQAFESRASLIVLQSVNVATGVERPPSFFSSLLLDLRAHVPDRRFMLLVDDTFSSHGRALTSDPVIDDRLAVVTDVGSSIGAPDTCCIIRGQDPFLHTLARDFPLQPGSAAAMTGRLPSQAQHVLEQNSALFRSWMDQEAQRLRWHGGGLTKQFAYSLVSIAPGVEINSSRFYSELERRGATRVSRGCEWSLEDTSFMVFWGHVDHSVLKSGLLAISSALDVWASTDSDLGLRTVY